MWYVSYGYQVKTELHLISDFAFLQYSWSRTICHKNQ